MIEKPIGVRSFHLTSWRGQSAVEDKDQDLPEEGAQDVANDAQLASHDESKVENSSADAQGVGAKTPEAAATARSPFRERSRNLSGRTKSLGEAPPDSKILYVGNLNFDLSSEELADTFREIGEVVNARIVQDYKGLSKGFGYIEFADREKAHAAIRSLDQTELQVRSSHIFVLLKLRLWLTRQRVVGWRFSSISPVLRVRVHRLGGEWVPLHPCSSAT